MGNRNKSINKGSEAKGNGNHKVLIAIIVAVVIIAAILAIILPDVAKKSLTGSASSNEQNNITGEGTMANYKAVIEIEDYGTITLELDGAHAPITVQNFVDLAESGFYDGLTFHRIMEGFMMQGGDPLGNGTGGSDKNITGEFAANGIDNPLSHTRGAISMARSQMPDSASSQFFICHQDALFLDGNYACFGYVTDGMDVVDAVCENSNPVDDNGTILPDEQPVIKSITVSPL